MHSGLLTFVKSPAPAVVRMVAATGVFAVTCELALAAAKPSPAGLSPAPIAVAAEPLAGFDVTDPAMTRFGKLVWRGGLVLSSSSPHFGGWSGLEMSADGSELLAISDAGTWMRARLTYAGAAPRSVDKAVLGPLRGRDGRVLSRRRDRDAEGLALVSGTIKGGEVFVSFEGNHRIGLYPVIAAGLGTPTRNLLPPKDLKRGKRDGLEALAVLAGGSNRGALVGFAEEANADTGRHAGWIWIGGDPRPLAVVARDGFALTGAASLADGSLLLLERRFNLFDGVAMRVRRIAADSIVAGAVLDGDVLIEAGMGQRIDNMEAIGVSTGPDGRTVLTILSDDNFNPLLQRTLLLQFGFAEESAEQKERGAVSGPALLDD